MTDKSNQIWYRYKYDLKGLKNECYDLINSLFIQLQQRPQADTLIVLTENFVNDIALKYSSMEMEEIRYALNEGLRTNDPPIFINVPTWNKFLRDYKKNKQLSKQKNQVNQFRIYQDRIKSIGMLTGQREIKKIGK